MADSNGWVTSPPSTLVKITGTSRDALNGQIGIVLQYHDERARYTVQMAITQDVVSLKPSNLAKCNLMQQAQGQYQFLLHNPALQQQVRQVYQRINNALPAAVQPEYLLVLLALLLGAAFSFLGFTKTFMVLTFVFLVSVVIGPDLVPSSNNSTSNTTSTATATTSTSDAIRRTAQTVARNAPARFAQLLRQQVPVVGPRIAANRYATAATAGLLLFLFVSALLAPTTATATSTTTNSSATTFTTTSATAVPPYATDTAVQPPEYYYKLGFEDATAALKFGTSLANVSTATATPVRSDDAAAAFDDSMPRQHYEQQQQSPKTASPWYTKLGTGVSLYYLFNTVKTLGQDPVSGQWSAPRLLQAARQMEPWRMGMVGLSVYKLFSTFVLGT